MWAVQSPEELYDLFNNNVFFIPIGRRALDSQKADGVYPADVIRPTQTCVGTEEPISLRAADGSGLIYEIKEAPANTP